MLTSLVGNMLASPDVIAAAGQAAGDLTLRRRLVVFQEETMQDPPDAHEVWSVG